MGQLNVSFDDALLAEIDRLAAQRGINRPELLRALVREAIGAEWKVGEVAAPVPQAIGMTQAPELVGQLIQMSIDLDRVLRDMDRREVRLGKALAARAALDDGAQTQLAGVLGDRVEDSLAGFEHRLGKQLARLPSETAMEDILARLEQTSQNLAKLPPPPPLLDPTSLAAQFVAIFAGALLALALFWGLLHRLSPSARTNDLAVEVGSLPDPSPVVSKHRSRHP
jgi:hypothetical protein